MFKKVAPYIGENKKYTIAAVILMSIGIIANVVSYFFLYQIIAPLIRGESIDTGFILVRVITVAVVILDEATASVDADNERAIQEAISELCKKNFNGYSPQTENHKGCR